MPGFLSGLGNGADRDEKETGEVHGRWGRDSGNAGTDAGEDERQVWAWRCREISRATAATSPHSATCSISSTFSAERLDGQGDRCDWPAQRGTEEGGGYAEGGIIPVNIGRGIAQAIAQPIMEDWRQANQVVKNIRNQYPVTDSIAGIHPAISAAQVANDVMSGDVGGDTALNLAQSVPILKGISGAAKALNKQSGATINGVKYIVDMPNTVRKNTAITVGQTLGPPANAYSRGGIMPVVGAGTGTSDSVPVVVAGRMCACRTARARPFFRPGR